MGGRRTIAAGHYRRGLARRGRVVLSRVAQPLSAHIEAGRTGSPEFRSDLANILAPLRHVDALVLACTHYPAARDWFAAALPHATLIDPAERMAAAIAAAVSTHSWQRRNRFAGLPHHRRSEGDAAGCGPRVGDDGDGQARSGLTDVPSVTCVPLGSNVLFVRLCATNLFVWALLRQRLPASLGRQAE